MDFLISQGSVATYCRWGGNLWEFSYKAIGERMLKIGPHLPKLLSNIKGLTFLRHSVFQRLFVELELIVNYLTLNILQAVTM